jgi:hypothetical protein
MRSAKRSITAPISSRWTRTLRNGDPPTEPSPGRRPRSSMRSSTGTGARADDRGGPADRFHTHPEQGPGKGPDAEIPECVGLARGSAESAAGFECEDYHDRKALAVASRLRAARFRMKNPGSPCSTTQGPTVSRPHRCAPTSNFACRYAVNRPADVFAERSAQVALRADEPISRVGPGSSIS